MSKIEKVIEYMESEEGKKSMEKFALEYVRKEKIKKERSKRVEEYLKDKNFDDIIKRLEKEHGKEWRDKCYNEGYEPYPNNKANLLLDWIERSYSPIKVPYSKDKGIGGMFSSAIYFIKGYYFELICGQGCFWRVYNNEKEVIFDL